MNLGFESSQKDDSSVLVSPSAKQVALTLRQAQSGGTRDPANDSFTYYSQSKQSKFREKGEPVQLYQKSLKSVVVENAKE